MATAAACAALAAVPLAGCGGGDERTIPHDQGSTLIRVLRNARDQAGDPARCDALLRSVSSAQAEVQQLPSSVSGDTRRTLVQGVDNLAQTATQECQSAQTTPTQTTPTATTPAPTTTETTPPPTTTTPTTPPPTTPTETTPPPTATTPAPGNGTGGVQPGQKKGAKKKQLTGDEKGGG